MATAVPIGEVKPFSSRQGIGAMLVEILYRPLLRFSEDGKLNTDLAEKVWWEDSGRSFHVRLSEANLKNVLYTIDHIQKLKIPEFQEGLKNLTKIDQVSPVEIVFRLREFDRIFPFMLSRLPILSGDPEKSTGDFQIESNEEGRVVLKRKITSGSRVNRIIVEQIPTARRVLRELVTGNVDITFLTDETDFKALSDLQGLAFGELESAFLYLVLVNHSRPSLKNIPWNKISANLNRSLLAEELDAKGLSPAYLPVRNVDVWAGDLIKIGGQVVASGNFKVAHSRPLSLSFLNNQAVDSRISLLLKRHLEELGISLELVQLEPQKFGNKILNEKDFDLVLLPFAIRDALTTNYFVFHSADSPGSVNLSGYSNREVDKYLEGARYEYDDDKAKRAFSKAMAAMIEDPPGIFLFWLRTPVLYRQTCSGFKFNTNEFFSSLKDVRCEPSVAN